MSRLLSSKTFIVIIVALGVAGLAWYGLTSGGTDSTSLLDTQTVGDGAVDKELVSTLLALRSIKLDGNILSQPAFKGLKDFSTEIVAEPIGRPNPFAPLVGAVTSVAATSSTKTPQSLGTGGKGR